MTIAYWVRESAGGKNHETAFVFDYVKIGLNTTSDFELPDNLALDKNGNLNAEPTGIYFDLSGTTLFVHAQHRGGDGKDKSVAITRN